MIATTSGQSGKPENPALEIQSEPPIERLSMTDDIWIIRLIWNRNPLGTSGEEEDERRQDSQEEKSRET